MSDRRRDGRAWTRVPAPGGDHLTSPQGGYLNGVAAVSADEAWAVGGTNDTGQTVIEHWNGTTWTAPPGFTGRVGRDVLRLPPVARRRGSGAARHCGCCPPGAETRSRGRTDTQPAPGPPGRHRPRARR